MNNAAIKLRQPDDMHLHLRQDEMLAMTVPATAGQFKRAVVMPNLKPPITGVSAMTAYRRKIVGCCKDFEPLMTFQITADFNAETVAELKDSGAVAGKLYPRGVTTNSESGWSDITALYPVFEEMQRCDVVLSLHGESPSSPVTRRELDFLPVLEMIAAAFPSLRIVLEHISRRESVEMIRTLPDRVAATITLHHMILTSEDLFGGVFQPHFFCKPILQPELHRKAVFGAAVSGSPKFFFGSDSAPHLKRAKEGPTAAAGVFSAPVLLPRLAELFLEADKLDALQAFTSESGADFYGLPYNAGQIELRKEPWTVPSEMNGVVPLYAGQTLPWCVAGRSAT